MQISQQYDIISTFSSIPSLAPYISTNKLITLCALPVISFDNDGYSSAEYLYRYLAKIQQTKFAIKAVHSKKETELFKLSLTNPQLRNSIDYTEEHSKPDFKAFANLWSSYCLEGSAIYYKLPRHLEAYYNILDDRKKYRDSVVYNSTIVQEVRTFTQNPTRYQLSIPVTSRPEPSSPTIISESLRQAEQISLPR